MVELSAMANYTLNRDCIDMSKFDEISELAIDNYGIVTAAQAVKIGVALKDVHEWIQLSASAVGRA